MNDINTIKELLNAEKLTYASHLKMIEEYEKFIEYRLIEQDNIWGIVLLLPAACSAFDAEMYPEAKYVVYLACSDERIIPQLIKEIPNDKDIVFKIHKPSYIDIIDKHFSLIWKRTYLSYTCKKQYVPEACSDVVKSSCIDEKLMSLWAKNRYSKSDIEK